MEQLLDYRARLVARFEHLPADLADVIAGVPEAEWGLRRAPDGRSVYVLIAQLRDLETREYLPCLRRILSEDDPQLEGFSTHRPADVNPPQSGIFAPQSGIFAPQSGIFDNSSEPMEALLAGYARAREEEMQLIREMPPSGWSRAGFDPPHGRRTVQWWVERALRHGLDHLAEIRVAGLPRLPPLRSAAGTFDHAGRGGG